MGLLQDIQSSLLDEKAKIGPILLKVRFLADRLGSDVLEDWVRFEAEGYPDRSSVPDYRKASLTLTGSFSNMYQQLNNVGIPAGIVSHLTGSDWETIGITDALPVIEDMVEAFDGSNFGIDASILKVALQGKIYEGMSIVDISAKIDPSAFSRVVSVVRSRLLDLVLEIEKRVPVASEISVGTANTVTQQETTTVSSITTNIFHAPVNQINNSGAGSTGSINIAQGDIQALKRAFEEQGLEGSDAQELADIVASEPAPDGDLPVGPRARAWWAQKAIDGAKGVAKVGVDIGKGVAVLAIKAFYGL